MVRVYGSESCLVFRPKYIVLFILLRSTSRVCERRPHTETPKTMGSTATELTNCNHLISATIQDRHRLMFSFWCWEHFFQGRMEICASEKGRWAPKGVQKFYVIYLPAEISHWKRLMTITLEFWKITLKTLGRLSCNKKFKIRHCDLN